MELHAHTANIRLSVCIIQSKGLAIPYSSFIDFISHPHGATLHARQTPWIRMRTFIHMAVNPIPGKHVVLCEMSHAVS